MVYFRMEDAVFAALCERWPQPEQRPALRVVAMPSIGVLRLAMEARRQDNGRRALADHLKDAFALLGG